MFWPILTFLLLAALVALHLWWRRRHAQTLLAMSRQQEALQTARQGSREAEEQAEAERDALFDSMLEGVLLLDAQGRIHLVNQSLRRLFRLPRDICGQTILEAFRRHELADLAERLRSEDRVVNFEFELTGPETRFLQVNAAAIKDREGRARQFILVFHDLTRIKELENTRQEFVANVSHELRTPLSLIKGFVETLLNGAKDDPEVASRFLNGIERHANRLNYLIEDLLTISRLESGRVSLNLQPVELHEFAGKVVDDLRSRAAARNVSLSSEIPSSLPAAMADAGRLQQVLVNLIENAINYGRSEGRVTVGGRALSDGQLEIWVEDDGPGIPAEAQERVFERFYRLDRARSREAGGTGLGLAIVKHVAQAHGGRVWVESRAGEGAKFFFTLPRALQELAH